jgi:copper homeostasis protein (lipoprotein)
MKTKHIIIICIIFVCLLISGAWLIYQSNFKSKVPNTTTINITDNISPTKIYDTYSGILPCADCTGVKTIIKFYKERIDSTSGSYVRSEVHLGADTKPIETKGDWKIIKGSKSDPNAEVYEMNVNSIGSSHYFQKLNRTTIKLLNKQLAEIQSSRNYILTKQN